MRNSAIAMSGAQTNSCNVQAGLRFRKAASAPHTDRRELRDLGSLELGRTHMSNASSVRFAASVWITS